MIFNTHNRTPKIEIDKTVKIILISGWSFMLALFLFFAIAISILSKSILPAVIILTPLAFIATWIAIRVIDMNKAYVQIDAESITVVNYCFFKRKEKRFTIGEIKTAEIALGYSLSPRGYRHSNMGSSYIIFRGDNGKYLFKVISCPDTNAFFGKYIEIQGQ